MGVPDPLQWTHNTVSGPRLSGLLAVPTGEGPWPGVVVIHDVFGVSRDLHDQARWLASEGFLALAPDLFVDGIRVACLYRTMRDLKHRSGPTFDRLEAARRVLALRPDCTGAVGVLGFCVGGDFALILAAGKAYRVASINYGAVPDDADLLLASACPIVGSYGRRDRRLPKAANKLEQALSANGIEHDIKEYPLAGHAFMNTAGRVVTMVGRPLAAGNHAASAEHARSRISGFLRSHLGPIAAG